MKNERLINQSTLTQQVAKIIKSRILNGELVSGDRIWAADVATELDVSIVPVKEALLTLVGEGLITNIPRRGSIIRQFSLNEIQELYDIRRILEVEALKIIINSNKIDEDFISQLKSINNQLGKLRRKNEFVDRHEAYEQDWIFHDTIIKQSQHGHLTAMYNRLNTQAQIIRFTSWDLGLRGDKTFDEHSAIIDALEKQDVLTGESAVVYHLNSILTDFNNRYGDQADRNEPIQNSEHNKPTGRRNTASS